MKTFSFFKNKVSFWQIQFLFGTIILFASCGNRFTNEEGLTVFRYNEPSNITSLDPAFARNQANIWATSQLYNSLLRLDENLNVVNDIAKEYTISVDGLRYTFLLRDDVFFHKNDCFQNGLGRKVNAHDFVYSFNRLVDQTLNSPGSWVMNHVSRKPNGALNVEAKNDSILVIHLNEPFPPMAGLLTMQYCSVIPHEAIARYGQDFRNNPVGTGPFAFKYWKEGVKLVFRKNENYFEFDFDGYRLPYLDAISITFIIDRQIAFLEFIKGNLDFLTSVDASYKDDILTPDGNLEPRYQDRFTMIKKPFLNTEYLGILVNPDNLPAGWPLKEKAVRQAINYGFDRAKMIRYLRNDVGIPAHAGFVPIGMPGFYHNSGGYAYNPDLARQILAESGYPGGVGLPVITLNTNQNYLDIAQYLQHELSRIGIKINIDVMPPATLRETVAKGEAAFFRASWIADYPDAENYLALFYSPNQSPAGPNYTHFSNPLFDKLYEKSITITDDSLRQTIYSQMDKIVIDEAPVVFLFYDQSVRFFDKNIEGLSNNPLNHLDLRWARFVK
jgi:ABC-type transport system substrate-binding protein